MSIVRAYAATKPGSELAPFEYELGPLGFDDVDIAVEHCGICFTDLLMLDNLGKAPVYNKLRLLIISIFLLGGYKRRWMQATPLHSVIRGVIKPCEIPQ